MADDGLRVERNLQIQLSDGVSLVGDVYMPDSGGPFPALLGYTPYRKDDMGGSFSEYGRRWFAKQGYACTLGGRSLTGPQEARTPLRRRG